MDVFVKFFSQDLNAGDLVGPAILEKLTGKPVTAVPLKDYDTETLHYMCVGSTLAHATAQTVLWSTGLQLATLRPRGNPLKILGVRGPLTAAALRHCGCEEVRVIGDGALSLPALFPPAQLTTHEWGWIPHYVDIAEPFAALADENAAVISPQQSLPDYIRRLTSCRTIVSSSLHGLIIAHAYGIPALYAKVSDRVFGGGFKFRDYYAFVGVEAQDIPIWDFTSDVRNNLSRATCPILPAIAKDQLPILQEDLAHRGFV